MRGSDEVQVPASSRREMYMRGRQAGIREALEACAFRDIWFSSVGDEEFKWVSGAGAKGSDIDSLIKYLELGNG